MFNDILATWRSVDAAACKAVYPGSIPGVASNPHKFNLDFFVGSDISDNAITIGLILVLFPGSSVGRANGC